MIVLLSIQYLEKSLKYFEKKYWSILVNYEEQFPVHQNKSLFIDGVNIYQKQSSIGVAESNISEVKFLLKLGKKQPP